MRMRLSAAAHCHVCSIRGGCCKQQRCYPAHHPWHACQTVSTSCDQQGRWSGTSPAGGHNPRHSTQHASCKGNEPNTSRTGRWLQYANACVQQSLLRRNPTVPLTWQQHMHAPPCWQRNTWEAGVARGGGLLGVLAACGVGLHTPHHRLFMAAARPLPWTAGPKHGLADPCRTQLVTKANTTPCVCSVCTCPEATPAMSTHYHKLTQAAA